jgi:hypothetical protein
MTKQTVAALHCPCCKKVFLYSRLVAALAWLDRDFAHRYRVTSGYRCPEHNAAVHGHPQSLHLFGLAMDLAPVDVDMPELVRAVLSVPNFAVGGFGWYPQRGMIHVDVRQCPANWCRINDHHGDLATEWRKRYPLNPLPKVPATLPRNSRVDSGPSLPSQPAAPSVPPTQPVPPMDSPSGTT